MSKFFNKPLIKNILQICFNMIKLKTFEKSNFNFMKHKLVFITIPLILLTCLMSFFILNLCSDKYDLDGLFENSKTVINLPVDKNADVDNATLNKMQKIATNLLNYNSNAQLASKYNGFVSEILKKTSKNEIKITTNKKFVLTQQQKEMLFNEFKMHFPNLIKLKNADEIESYSLNNTQKNLEFWLQLSAAAAILIFMLLLYFGFKFKKIGFWSAILVALINLIFSVATTFLVLVIMTKRVNLTFITAMSFYFTINLTALFSEIRKQLPEKIKINKVKAAEIANKAIQKTLPSAVFIVAILFVALVCSTIFCVVFDNYILFYFALSTAIGVLIDLFFNLFCNGQIWVMLKRKELKKKEGKKETSKKLNPAVKV